MKMDQTNQFETEIKMLHKKFKVLDRPNTKILYEFCEFDPIRAYKVLSFAKTMRNPGSIIQMLMKNPEKSEDYLNSLIARYDKEIGEQIDMIFQKSQVKKVNNQQFRLGYQFFKSFPEDTIGTIMSYLDPYSFKYFSFTCSSFYKIGQAQSLSELYKQICKVLFSKNEPVLPGICRFQVVKNFVLAHPQQYFPYFQNFKNAVSNNLRLYVWKNEPKQYKLEMNYYKNFGSYKNLFQECPRVNLNGYYICKHKYVKTGEKDINHPVAPIHIIYYYRYMRFLQDGSVIYFVVNKKLKEEDIMKHLTKQILTLQPPPEIIGQYMQYKDRLYIKTVKQNSLFYYQMEIRSTQNKICNQLCVKDYKLQLIDKSYMTQTLYQANPLKQEIIFNYCRNQSIQMQNSPRIQACSL